MPNLNRALPFLLLILFFIAPPVKGDNEGQSLFDISYLTVEGKRADYVVEDLNSDGLNDLLFFSFKEKNGKISRHFSLFYQNKNGFRDAAGQHFEVNPSAIVFDVADVSSEAGREIVFISRDGIYFHARQNQLYSVTPKKLLEVESMFKLTDTNFLKNLNFALDLNQDGIDEIFIPRFNTYTIFKKTPGQNYEVQSKLRNRLKRRVAARESYMSVKEVDKSFFVAAYGAPSIIYKDYNGDKRNDIIIIQKNNLLVFFQDRMGNYSNENSTIVNLGFEISQEFDIVMESAATAYRRQEIKDQIRIQYIKDINNDGLLDVVVEKFSLKAGFLDPRQHYLFYFGKKNPDAPSTGGIFDKTPDQIIFNPGLVGDHCLEDLNYDGKSDMILPIVEFGILKVISMMITGKVSLKNNIYLLNEDGRYPEKPDYIQKFRVKFDLNDYNVMPVWDTKGDINSDGKLDVLLSFDNNELLIFPTIGIYEKNTDRIQSQGDVVKRSIRFQIEVPEYGAKVKYHRVNDDLKSDIVMVYPFRKKDNVCILIAK